MNAALQPLIARPATAPRFAQTYCSQCGQATGPGNSGHSSCTDHHPIALVKLRTTITTNAGVQSHSAIFKHSVDAAIDALDHLGLSSGKVDVQVIS